MIFFWAENIYYFFSLDPSYKCSNPDSCPLRTIRTWIHVPERQLANNSKLRLKRGRPIGSKDVHPEKRRIQMSIGIPEMVHELRLKLGRPIGLKDVPPHKRRT